MMRLLNIIVFLGLLFGVEGIASVLEAKETKRILILWSEERGHPAHDQTEQGIIATFLGNSYFDVRLYNEYLDVTRFPGPSQASSVSDYLRHKYAGMKIDAVIAVYPHAVDFLLARRSILFPGVPIIACEITRDYAKNLEHSPIRRFVTGTIAGDNVTNLIALILQIKPDTKHIALVAGTSPNDIYGEQVFHRGLSTLVGKIEILDLTKLPMEDTLSRVGALPPHTIVLYESILKDGAAKSFVPREALSLVSRAANAPVFGLYGSYLGFGIVGGPLLDFQQHGREAAAIALRILRGEPPETVPFGGEDAYASTYDWRELNRWGISEKAVPAGGVILYKPHTLWKDHWRGILGGVLLIIIQGILILGLLINLRRRQKAERSLSESRQNLQRLATRLIETQEEELTRLSRELHDNLTQRVAGLAIDAGIIEQRLGPLHAEASQELSDMKMTLVGVSEEIHDLSRQLHPSIIDDLGFVEAVKSECDIFSRRSGIAVSFMPSDISGSIPKDIALCLYRVIQEGLQNIEKHAKTNNALISLQGFSGGIRLLIQDHGVGFDCKAVRKKAGLGLSSIRERVGLINGTMSVKSEPGKGTEVEIIVSLEGKT